MYFLHVAYIYLCVQDLQFIYIIPKSLSIIFIIVMLMLDHINIAFRSIQFILVHFNSFSPFVLFWPTLVHQIWSTSDQFGPHWSISIYFSPFWSIGPFQSTLVHFGPSVHHSPFCPLWWCFGRRGVCWKRSCLIDNYVKF